MLQLYSNSTITDLTCVKMNTVLIFFPCSGTLVAIGQREEECQVLFGVSLDICPCQDMLL